MKKILLLILLISSSILNSFAFESKQKEVESKKKEALQWYVDNEYRSKAFHYDPKKEISLLKNKALNWYGNRVGKELEITKQKALKWYTH